MFPAIWTLAILGVYLVIVAAVAYLVLAIAGVELTLTLFEFAFADVADKIAANSGVARST